MSNAEVASNLLAAYGSYPIASTFELTDSSPELPPTEAPAYSAAFDSDLTSKRHAACDECRKRKLKCSGEPAGCGRCVKQKLTCHYSVQKQMGRPRKRQKVGDTPNQDTRRPSRPTQQQADQGSDENLDEAHVDPILSEKDLERTNFQNICPSTLAQSVRLFAGDARVGKRTTSRDYSRPGTQKDSQSSDTTSPDDTPLTPPVGDNAVGSGFYPADVPHWPDFSDMHELPRVVQDRVENEYPVYVSDKDLNGGSHLSTTIGSMPYADYFPGTEIDARNPGQLATVPACPCLPNLYLTLSNLTALTAFPVSSGMVETLLHAHRTCRAVIYCPVCPQKMQTGSQNVFLSTMLLGVLADHWHRVKKASARELRLGFDSSDSESPEPVESLNIRQDLEWRTFGYHLIRAFVFGDHSIPDPPIPGYSTTKRKPDITPTQIASEDSDTTVGYTLDALVNSLERRQKQWHSIAPYQGSQEFVDKMRHRIPHLDDHAHAHGFPRGYAPGMTLEDIKKCEDDHRASGGAEDSMLCLKIVKHSRHMMKSLECSPPVIQDWNMG